MKFEATTRCVAGAVDGYCSATAEAVNDEIRQIYRLAMMDLR